MKRLGLLMMLVTISSAVFGQTQTLVFPENMKVLNCDMPTTTYRFAGSNAPGQLFMDGEQTTITLAITNGNDTGVVKDYAVEIQEITTRDPDAISKAGYTDTTGFAPLISKEGNPIVYSFTFIINPGKTQTMVELKSFPLPPKHGTYALILVRGQMRQFLGTLARLPQPRPYGTLENTPIFGEGQFLYGEPQTRANIYWRMGVRGWRSEISWTENADFKWDWSVYDRLFAAAAANGQQIMVTPCGTPPWTQPFGTPTPASGWSPDSGGYWGTGDWECDPKWYQRYANWIQAFCYRYWKDGKGALWGIDHYNEPWEGGGISGWARDMNEYNTLLKAIATAAHTVDPRIKVLAASSIMNTEDKLYTDGSRDMDQYVDMFTDHYVLPSMSYGPLVAKAHGKQSMETETWIGNTEYKIPQVVVQFLASGQQRMAPWHPQVLFDNIPGGDEYTLIPTPACSATATFNYFVTGKHFTKMVFQQHEPQVFQFGEDTDRSALLVLFGKMEPIGLMNKELLWPQVDTTPGGRMTIDNKDGLLQFYDIAGNPLYAGQATVTLPMTIYPTYITSKQGPVAATERLKMAKIESIRPVEIVPHDFTQRLTDAGTTLAVDVHNVLNRPITGAMTITTPAEISLATNNQQVTLAAGETKRLSFPIAKATPLPSNAYACKFEFTSDAGKAEYAELMNVAVAVKGTKTIDGNLDDWKDVPGVMIMAGADKMDPMEIMRRPWLDATEKQPDGTFAEVKLAWDDSNLYVAARVHDPKPVVGGPRMEGRNEDLYFHTKDDDNVSPYKEFIAKYPGRSFSEFSYIYRDNPENPKNPLLPTIPFRRERLQIALDVTPDWHDLTPDTDKVPQGFHAWPDTDYEYSLYLCNDGGSELWRQLAPGVPRIHDFPRQKRGPMTTGPVPGSQHVVKLDGTTYIYEMAIPKSELKTMDLKAGTLFGFNWKIGNVDGPNVEYGWDKAATRINGLSFHPYWERTPDDGVKWALIN